MESPSAARLEALKNKSFGPRPNVLWARDRYQDGGELKRDLLQSLKKRSRSEQSERTTSRSPLAQKSWLGLSSAEKEGSQQSVPSNSLSRYAPDSASAHKRFSYVKGVHHGQGRTVVLSARPDPYAWARKMKYAKNLPSNSTSESEGDTEVIPEREKIRAVHARIEKNVSNSFDGMGDHVDTSRMEVAQKSNTFGLDIHLDAGLRARIKNQELPEKGNTPHAYKYSASFSQPRETLTQELQTREHEAQLNDLIRAHRQRFMANNAVRREQPNSSKSNEIQRARKTWEKKKMSKERIWERAGRFARRPSPSGTDTDVPNYPEGFKNGTKRKKKRTVKDPEGYLVTQEYSDSNEESVKPVQREKPQRLQKLDLMREITEAPAEPPGSFLPVTKHHGLFNTDTISRDMTTGERTRHRCLLLAVHDQSTG